MKISLLILSLVFSLQAFAQNDSKGGGGGTLVFQDGKWQMSDVFVENVPLIPGQYGEEYYFLSEDIKKELKKIQKIAENFLPFGNQTIPDMNLLGKFFDGILDEKTEYYLVDTLPCEPDLFHLHGENSSMEQVSYGCTISQTTYLMRSIFESTEMNSSLKALMIIHERLHAWISNRNLSKPTHNDIAFFISDLTLMMKIYEEQQAGEKRILKPREVAQLESFMNHAKRLQILWMNDDWAEVKVHPNGGGALIRYKAFSKHPIMGKMSNSPFYRFYTQLPEVDSETFISIDSQLVGGIQVKASDLSAVQLNGVSIKIEQSSMQNTKLIMEERYRIDEPTKKKKMLTAPIKVCEFIKTFTENNDVAHYCEKEKVLDRNTGLLIENNSKK